MFSITTVFFPIPPTNFELAAGTSAYDPQVGRYVGLIARRLKRLKDYPTDST